MHNFLPQTTSRDLQGCRGRGQVRAVRITLGLYESRRFFLESAVAHPTPVYYLQPLNYLRTFSFSLPRLVPGSNSGAPVTVAFFLPRYGEKELAGALEECHGETRWPGRRKLGSSVPNGKK